MIEHANTIVAEDLKKFRIGKDDKPSLLAYFQGKSDKHCFVRSVCSPFNVHASNKFIIYV